VTPSTQYVIEVTRGREIGSGRAVGQFGSVLFCSTWWPVTTAARLLHDADVSVVHIGRWEG
jgi:hypothetical protein